MGGKDTLSFSQIQCKVHVGTPRRCPAVIQSEAKAEVRVRDVKQEAVSAEVAEEPEGSWGCLGRWCIVQAQAKDASRETLQHSVGLRVAHRTQKQLERDENIPGVESGREGVQIFKEKEGSCRLKCPLQ